MNSRPSLESLDLELFAALQRERQADLRREAQAQRLAAGSPHSSRPRRWWLLAGVAAVPIVFWLAHLVR